MASRSSAPVVTGAGATKKTRTRSPAHYVARLNGEDKPTLVIAKTLKDALAAIVTIKAAENADLIAAGKNDWPIIDTTNQAQARVDQQSADADRRAAA